MYEINVAACTNLWEQIFFSLMCLLVFSGRPAIMAPTQQVVFVQSNCLRYFSLKATVANGI